MGGKRSTLSKANKFHQEHRKAPIGSHLNVEKRSCLFDPTANKMGNPSNGPAAVMWLNIFCLDVSMCHPVTLVPLGHWWSHAVILGIAKYLKNDGLPYMIIVAICVSWSH